MNNEKHDNLMDTLRKAFFLEEKGDIEGAIRAFKIAAKSGSNDARSKLGTIFDDVLKPSRPERAVYWYKQGAKAGSSGCAWNLAMHYAGLGKMRGYLYWLKVAKDMGDADASFEFDTREWWNKKNPRWGIQRSRGHETEGGS